MQAGASFRTLYRPVGLEELSLIWDSGMRAFPPRLPEQPIFYPVANENYAVQIARDWNANSPPNFAGYVTRFSVYLSMLETYEEHIVGSAEHVEYWIPAQELENFNGAIVGEIAVDAAFFGAGFKGFVPTGFGLKGKDAAEQLRGFSSMLDYSAQDFSGESWTNRKAVFLNFLYWAQSDFSSIGIDHRRRDEIVRRLRWFWDFHETKPALPGPEPNAFS